MKTTIIPQIIQLEPLEDVILDQLFAELGGPEAVNDHVAAVAETTMAYSAPADTAQYVDFTLEV